MVSADSPDASVLKALGHPLRMRVLTFIAERGEASPVEMSRALDVRLATVSHHTRVLRDSGLVELSHTRPRRGAVEHYYRAVAAPFLDDDQWELLPIPARRQVSAQLFRNVFEDAAAAGRQGGFDDATAHIARRALDLDERGRRDLSKAVLALLKQAEVIQERSDKRRRAARPDDPGAHPSELAILHFVTSDPRARPPRLP
jgi:DNA-binding transcriptional ArsR family regulator